MARLAIKGHPTRGNEVIETLEMLGGKREGVFLGNVIDVGYYIDSNGYIDYGYANFLDNTIIYTLDEFLEKFPYKVGDKVVYEDKRREITNMVWEEQTNTVAYKLDDKLYCNVIGELQPYKEEIEEEDGVYAYNEINCYHQDFGDKVRIRLGGDYEVKVEDNITYIVKKQPQYPKTYEECYDEDNNELHFIYVDKNERDLYESFIKLIRCRNAYWKIAGEQMGLGKPWEPDWTDNYQKKWTINFYQGEIELTSETNVGFILAFPTKEMRDAFFENFKYLIKKCMRLI